MNRFKCIFLLSLASLLLEVFLLRLFSVVVGDSLHYFPISMALLGASAGGMRLAQNPDLELDALAKKSMTCLVGLSVLFPFAACIACLVLDALNPDNAKSLYINSRPLLILIFGGITVPPFYYLGCAIASCFATEKGRVSTLYFFDLLGASLGILLALLLMNSTVSTCWLILAATPLCLLLRARIFLSVCLVLIVLLQVLGLEIPVRTVRSYRHLQRAGEVEVSSRWTAIAYMEILQSGEKWKLHQDNSSTIAGLPPNWSDLETPLWITCAQRFTKGESIFVAAAGLGLQMVQAERAGFRRIVGAEINGHMLDFASGVVDLSQLQRFFHEDGVSYVIDNARHLLAKNSEKFDVILIPPAGSPAVDGLATAGSYLGTEEALSQYYDALNDNGILIFGWRALFLLEEGAGAGRFLGMLTDSEGRFGNIETKAHLAFLYPEYILLKKSPFTDAERTWLSSLPKTQLLEWETISESAEERQGSPRITDDFPFLTNGGLRDRQLSFFDKEGTARHRATFHLLVVASNVFAILAVLVLLVWPLRKRETGPEPWWLIFAGLGLGFMFCEVALIEQVVLNLGHPMLASALCLSTLLFGLSLGSYMTSKLSHGVRNLGIFLSLGIGVNLLLFSQSGILLRTLLRLSSTYHLLSVALLLIGVGGVLGLSFPEALARVAQQRGRSEVAVAWAINGALSVMAVNLASVVTQIWGISSLFALSACSYGMALLGAVLWAAHSK